MSKLLITGGTGLLGVNWALTEKHHHEITLLSHSRNITIPGVNIINVNLGSKTDLNECVKKISPDFVIHAAGITNVEVCQADLAMADFVNVAISKNVSDACCLFDIPMVYISTDHLFDGNSPFKLESDVAAPLNHYAYTKNAAEKGILSTNPNSLIIRTNFYGWGPSYRQSFSDYIINSLRNNRAVSLFDDVFFTPILIQDLISVVNSLLRIDSRGIFNVVSDLRVSKFQFGIAIAKAFSLDLSLINQSSILLDKNLYLRPLDMSLSNHKVSRQLNIKIGDIYEHIYKLRMMELMGYAEKIRVI